MAALVAGGAPDPLSLRASRLREHVSYAHPAAAALDSSAKTVGQEGITQDAGGQRRWGMAESCRVHWRDLLNRGCTARACTLPDGAQPVASSERWVFTCDDSAPQLNKTCDGGLRRRGMGPKGRWTIRWGAKVMHITMCLPRHRASLSPVTGSYLNCTKSRIHTESNDASNVIALPQVLPLTCLCGCCPFAIRGRHNF